MTLPDTFERYPEFITNDPRNVHGYDVGWDSDTQTKRYQGWFTSTELVGKTVLDLGCCGAAVGACVLDHRASSYTGIEISDQIADMAEENLADKWHGKWQIVRSSVEAFLANNDRHYDIIVAAGVLHGITDLLEFLRVAAHKCDHMLIEAYHPQLYHVGWLTNRLAPSLTDTQTAQLVQFLNEIEMRYPVIEVNPQGRMCLDDQQGSAANILKLAPSIAAFDVIMHRLGFTPNLTPYNTLKASVPRFYGRQRRFAVMYDRTHEPYGMSYSELRATNKLEFESWKKS